MVYKYIEVMVDVGEFKRFEKLSLPDRSVLGLFLSFKDSALFKLHQEDVFFEARRVLVDDGSVFISCEDVSSLSKIGEREFGFVCKGLYSEHFENYTEYKKEEK